MEYEFYYNVKTECFTDLNRKVVAIVCKAGTEYTSYHLKQELKKYYEATGIYMHQFPLEGDYLKERFHATSDLKKAYDYIVFENYPLQFFLENMEEEVDKNRGTEL